MLTFRELISQREFDTEKFCLEALHLKRSPLQGLLDRLTTLPASLSAGVLKLPNRSNNFSFARLALSRIQNVSCGIFSNLGTAEVGNTVANRKAFKS